MPLRRGLTAVCTALALVSAAVAAHAQGPEPGQTNTDVPWRTSYFPYLSGLSNDGPLISARIRRSQAAPYEERVTARAFMQLDVGIGFRGTRFVTAQFGAPLLVKNWRFHGFAIASRESRYGFFGIGNGTTFDQPTSPMPTPSSTGSSVPTTTVRSRRADGSSGRCGLPFKWPLSQ